MSGSKKKVVMASDIPRTVAPDAVTMAGRPDGTDRDLVELRNTDVRDPAAVDEQFPTDALSSTTKQDELMEMKKQAVANQVAAGAPNGATEFGMLVAKDSDFEWLRRKQEKEAEANFQQWFASNFDRMSPEQKKTARELYPEFYAQRMALLDKQCEMARKIAHLKLNGIQNKEDMLLQYAIEAGFVDTNPLDNILHPERTLNAKDLATRQSNYRRGLFNHRPKYSINHGQNARDRNAFRAQSVDSAAIGTFPVQNNFVYP